jgi:hypothetical protein
MKKSKYKVKILSLMAWDLITCDKIELAGESIIFYNQKEATGPFKPFKEIIAIFPQSQTQVIKLEEPPLSAKEEGVQLKYN